ncbi:GspE/PulE family protein [Nonlabens ulvanivorans]|uniref:GspE/PulE family protein n=1 Tax=Nonlabens ulvanivorans TaxID=906888 RepID=UPI0037C92074
MKDLQIPSHIKQLLTAEQAKFYNVIPFEQNLNGDYHLYHKSDAVIDVKKEIEMLLGNPIAFEKVTEDFFNRCLAFNYRVNSDVKASKLNVDEDVVDEIIKAAQNVKTSDIHIEPLKKETRIRFRIDGALKVFYKLQINEHPLLVNKIKIKANLNISEKRRNQDGRISMKSGGSNALDIRVSCLPSLHGEKIVMRLLESEQENVDIFKVGFSDKQLEVYKKAYNKSNGIILISGPTGSGKTTTLYATLKELNKEGVNILTVEDPIEYTLDGINQVQVKQDIGFDFAAALKTFLRQDPDIIMVGEIRDQETAQMAVKASLTGHLVLSTIHTNSALGTIDRLKDMGIPSYLISSTLNLSVAQRLVRLLCDNCRREVDSPIDWTGMDQKSITSHAEPEGCVECHYTGYRGRTALFELIEMNTELSQAIKTNQMDYDKFLTKQGFRSLKDQALHLLKEKKTSFEEIYSLLIE